MATTKVAKKKKSKAGRKTVMTEIVLGKLMAGAAYDMTIEEMSLYAGINPDTYYEYAKKNKKFSEKIQALRETPVMKAREKIVKAIESDTNTAKWYLQRKKKKEFSTRLEIEDMTPFTLSVDDDFDDA